MFMSTGLWCALLDSHSLLLLQVPSHREEENDVHLAGSDWRWWRWQATLHHSYRPALCFHRQRPRKGCECVLCLLSHFPSASLQRFTVMTGLSWFAHRPFDNTLLLPFGLANPQVRSFWKSLNIIWNLCDRSFSFIAPSVWNSQPARLRNLPCLSEFKTGLKTFLFRLAFPQT